MKYIKQYLFGLVAGALWALGTANAQEDVRPNSIESMNVVQQGSVLNVKLTFKEPLRALPAAFSVAKPARMAFDFPNTTNGLGKSSQAYNEGDLKSANIVQAEDRTRVVLNLHKAMTYEATIDGNSLLLALVPSATTVGMAQIEHFAQARPSALSNTIRDIAFRRGKDGEGRITVDLTDANAGIDIKQQGSTLVVDFAKVTVPETLRKRLDVTDFATPVLTVQTDQQGANTRMIITPRGLWEHNAYQSDSQFVIEVKQVIVNPNKLVQGSRGGYQGEKLSLNFQNVDVRRLLQVIGEFTGMNMVVSDSVSGSITLILKDVPWDQALDIIMQQKGLDMRKNGNVILIAPREEIATKEKLDFESKVQIGDLEPLQTESFQMNYIKAEAVQKLLIDPKQTLLSKRGSALLDDRSNMMFVKDTPSRLDDVRAMIAKVDIPARQVMIEARIVEAGDSFAKNLGIRLSFGATNKTSSVDSVTGRVTTTVEQVKDKGYIVNSDPRSSSFGLVNLPATPRSGTPGLLNLSLYDNSLTQFLNLEISALEADGRGKVISSPRVMTANQVEAIIEQGVEIPYQQATSSGATSVSFRKANLSLKVKPQITPDGKITMTLDVNKDTPNTRLSTGAGVAIDTKHVKTEVLVENGGTVVIGGIYTQEKRTNTQRIPFFGDLPYVGWMFKNREWIDDKTELLVFITPRIVVENLSLR
ncbi:MAG: type IV pilus secretin PilQ [Candidatus Accumulibacter phosphatis]|uniref:Type IV pilus biogenesis and competence protein PilQ n=2 Tax=Candidatus Accumulibacter TaxID=327159 RepID=A0A080MA98_9PROT|nr:MULTISPECIES: type IV pilus secretin PilQ [Candidatus Accumulibacter]KFB78222.1 MAG: Type IV pilus biogenesis and competence protein PilQ precursor [Candidatus Accumulibacter cognatus]MBL8400530.1 type IV pilus secretin PilQ [Accumulibacter sp.]MCC2866506.1 type IV pilus secretin PilQ [Candidatus Accumulibacter phosphatis]MCM8579297.1 type IV pilus secretin PilQ [Accumulibacter sp.]MCM8622706.1 type IV pilus secretin PilQ [Accumulibacter sp.]